VSSREESWVELMGRLVSLTAIVIVASQLAAQEGTSGRRECSSLEDSLRRLLCYDDLALEASSGIWDVCEGARDSVRRSSCYAGLKREAPSREWVACGEGADPLGRLPCYDSLAREKSLHDWGVCATTEGSLARLRCYDGLRSQASASDPEAPAGAAEWEIRQEVDPGTNRTVWIASLYPDEERSTLRGPAVLGLRCSDSGLEVMTGVNEPLPDPAPLVIRFDEDEPQEQVWNRSLGEMFLFAGEAQRLWFLEQLQVSQLLTVSVTPLRAPQATAVYRLGSNAMYRALVPIRDNCPTVPLNGREARW
jgi:hypothetical protein